MDEHEVVDHDTVPPANKGLLAAAGVLLLIVTAAVTEEVAAGSGVTITLDLTAPEPVPEPIVGVSVHRVVDGVVVYDLNSESEGLRLGTVDELREADEVMLLSSVRGVTPVVRLDGRELGTGPVTTALRAAFERAVLEG